MSYQVLARKWRPQNFKEMVGQQHVLRGLINALDNDRLHHAYLFTGTRGVGKTTVARILAKCLNCETGITSEPCGTCGACQEITAGRFVDLIEVDAASRTKVEDTRELLDNVQYAPTHGRFKVYLIDEVHMLSGHSFNALLKTLEEPPEHVKFLFATTDPQKLPVTILSRCLQFNLKRMTLDMISGHLKHLLEAENIPGEDDSIRLLSRAADGSMRDALSLMDQAIAFGNGSLVLNDVQEMLGSIANDPLLALIKMVASGDGAGIIAKVEDMAGVTPDFAAATDALIAMLHQLAVLQVVKGADEDNDNVRELANHLSKEDIQLYYQIAINGRRDLSLAPDPRSGFEMLLLRMLAFRPTTVAPLPQEASNAVPELTVVAEPLVETPESITVDDVQHEAVAPTTENEVAEPEADTAVERDVATKDISEAVTNEIESSEPAENKKKIIASQVGLGESLPAPAPAPAPAKSLDQDFIDEDETPPAWDEYDQMLSQASSISIPQEAVDVDASDATEALTDVSSKQAVAEPMESKQASEAPPWNETSGGQQVSEPAIEAAPESSAESASITDLLFADFPEEMGVDTPTENEAAHTETVDSNPMQAIQVAEPAPPIAKNTTTSTAVVISDNADKWYQTIESLSIAGLAAELAKNCIFHDEDNEKIELHLDSSSEMLMTNSAINEIEAALTEHYGQSRKLVVVIRELSAETPAQYNQRRIGEVQADAEQSIVNDSFVKALSDRFGARVVPGSVKPKS